MPIQPDDVIYNKASITEHCVRRIKEEYAKSPVSVMLPFTNIRNSIWKSSTILPRRDIRTSSGSAHKWAL